MLSTTATYIQPTISANLRASAFSYVETDIPAGRTIAEHRRERSPRTGSGGGARSLVRAARRSFGRHGRYPDDPVGNPETTDGGW